MAQPNDTEYSTPTDLGPRFARMTAVIRMTGLCRATIYRMIADKRFPAQVRIGSRAMRKHCAELRTQQFVRLHRHLVDRYVQQ